MAPNPLFRDGPELHEGLHPGRFRAPDTVGGMSKKVLITGSSGFLGGVLVGSLRAAGFETVGLDLLAPAAGHSPDRFVHGDLRSREVVRTALDGVDVVVHAAASVPLRRNAEELRSVNVGGTRTLALGSRDVETFIHISSSAVYGIPQQLPVTVASPTSPVEPYGRSKLDAELALGDVFATGTAPRTVVLRPRTIVSPSRSGLFSLLFDAVHNGWAVPVLGSTTTLQLVHAEDVASVVLAAIYPSWDLPVVNLGSSHCSPLRDELSELITRVGSTAKVLVLPPRASTAVLGAASKARLVPFAPWHTKTYGSSNVVDLEPLHTRGLSPEFSNIDSLLAAYHAYVADPSQTKASSSSVHTSPLRSQLTRFALRALREVA